VKFQTLHVQNFLTLKRASVDLADKGLHLIQGANEDDTSAVSNGAGKSTLVDALLWCLYGVTARGVKADGVLSKVAKKDCAVSTSFSNGATQYTVSRYRKHKTFKSSVRLEAVSGGAIIDMSKGTDPETQKEIERVLGASYEVFMAAVYSAQEQLPDLPRAGDRDLKRLIEEAAGLQRIERAYEQARVRANGSKSNLEVALVKRTARRDAIARIEGQIVTMSQKRDEWDAFRQIRVNDAKQKLTDAEGTLKAHAGKLLKVKPEVDQAVLRMAAIDAALSEHRSFEQSARTAETAHNSQMREVAVEKANLQRYVDELARDEQRLADINLGRVEPCEMCGRAHSPEHVEELLVYTAALVQTARDAVTTQKSRLALALDGQKTLHAEVIKRRALVPDVSAIMAERTLLKAKVDSYGVDLSMLERLKRAREDAKSAIAARESEANPHESASTMLAEQLREENAALVVAGEKVEQLTKEVSVAEAVVKVFGPAGVRAQILDTVTPYLNARTADYLSVLSDGNMHATWTTLTKTAAGDLREKFAIEVANDKGADSFAGLSGGEKRKVRLATALALQDLVASRATQPIDLWIGDEIDDALDPAGLERLMTILERKARERGTVIVISHSDLRDWVDNVTIVRKAGGESTVEGSLCT
jgi:DNA repair exonuclease SbcCD ATPase subunit